MKYIGFKDSFRKNDPDIESRIRAEKLRVDLAVPTLT
jgi:hypothetical protein